MSMTVLTILQIAGIMAAYLGSVLLLPWILLRRKLSPYRASVRLMACFVAGHFYLINLVMALQLLHISCRLTLVIGTLLPFLAAVLLKDRAAFFARLDRASGWVRLAAEKQLGFKTILLRLGRRLGRFFSRVLKEWIAPRWLDLLLTGGIVALVFCMYGANALTTYGYCASDVPVHNYWINEMGRNHIFAAGVYPFGFHCIIYYLHTVFSIPTYVLLRLFFPVQTLMIHLMLLAFLKAVCRSKYAAYAGIFAYIMTDAFYMYAYARFYSALPQEFGMLFILPSIYFIIAFLQQEESSLPEKTSGFWKPAGEGKSGFYLAMASISISLTLAGHFYDAIVTALLCAGIAVGFCFRCVKWRYLKRVIAAGLAGIFLAVLPMGIAYAAGTPLEGSLYWGMSVVAPQDAEGEENPPEEGEPDGEQAEQAVNEGKSGLRGKLGVIMDALRIFVANDNAAAAWFFVISTLTVLLLGLLWCALHRPEYGAVLVSVGVFMLILFILQASKRLGIPQVLEEGRCPIYVAYGMAAVWSLCVDAGLLALFREKKAIHMGSLAAMAVVCLVVVLTGTRERLRVESMQTNSAVICLTNIIRENRDGGTWTICSANDELQMARDYGYHYETIDFLREMQTLDADTAIHIPTDTVYFFIDKARLSQQEEGDGLQEPERAISVERAEAPLPGGGGISAYEEGARWITMSHMYYWAQAFQRLYPSEMEVYYETDEFVCYRVRQNTYSLYNFAIDYGYN